MNWPARIWMGGLINDPKLFVAIHRTVEAWRSGKKSEAANGLKWSSPFGRKSISRWRSPDVVKGDPRSVCQWMCAGGWAVKRQAKRPPVSLLKWKAGGGGCKRRGAKPELACDDEDKWRWRRSADERASTLEMVVRPSFGKSYAHPSTYEKAGCGEQDDQTLTKMKMPFDNVRNVNQLNRRPIMIDCVFSTIMSILFILAVHIQRSTFNRKVMNSKDKHRNKSKSKSETRTINYEWKRN